MVQQNAKLSKNNPKILARAYNDDNAEYAEKWQGMTQYEWEQMGMRLHFLNMLQNASVYGYSVSKVCWDPKPRGGWDNVKKEWVGGIKHQVIHPAYFWVDTQTTTFNDARNMGTIRPVDLEWAVSQWPKLEKELREEATKNMDHEYARYNDGFFDNSEELPIYENQTADTLTRRFTSLFAWLINYKPRGDEYSATTGDKDTDIGSVVWLSEAFFEDNFTKHVKIEDIIPTQRLQEEGLVTIEDGSGRVLGLDGQEMKQEDYPTEITAEYDEPMFPRGRRVMRVGNTILNPEIKKQVYAFSKWPFQLMPYHELPFMWQGSNAVESSRSSQDMLNVTISHLVHHVKVAADPIRVVEQDALSKNKLNKVRKIKGKAGELIVMQTGKIEKIKNLAPASMDPAVFALIDILKKDIERQQFMNETAQGVRGGQKTAQEAARLDMNSNDLVAQRAIHTDLWVQATAGMIAEHIQKYYDIDRRVRIIGANGAIANTEMTDELKRVEFDIVIEPGSTLPFDKAVQKANYTEAYTLLDQPTVNPMLEDMLRILEIANREKILAKHQQTQLFNKFIELSTAAAQAQQLATQGEEGAMQAAQMQAQLMPQVQELMAQVVGVFAQGDAARRQTQN